MTQYRYQHLIRQDCPVPPGTHVVVYCRDSGGEEQDRSVAQQREAAEEYCTRFGLVVERLYADEATQATAVEKRDEFALMHADLRQRFPVIYDPAKRTQRAQEKPFALLCWKSNRLGRDLIHTRNVKSDLRLRGITIVSLVSSFETGNPALDALVESFFEFQDEELLREISGNARRGLAQLVSLRDTDPEFRMHNPDWPSTGSYLGIMPGGVPTGFKGERIIVGTYKRKNGKRGGELREVQRLVPDPELWDRCRLAWQMRHEGAAIREIMKATRLFTTASSYAAFFSNRIYTGTLEYGGQQLENFVPALIPLEWWQQEQERRAERAKKQRAEKVDPMLDPRRVGSRYLLSGLLYCGQVDGQEHPMLGNSATGKNAKRGAWEYYICTVKKNSRDHKCDSRRLGAKPLEQAVIDCLMRDVLNLDNLRPLAQAIAGQLADVNQDAAIRLSAVQSELEQVERQIGNLTDAIEQMGLSPTLRDKLTKREAERERLKLDMDQLEHLLVRSPDMTQVADELLEDWLLSIRAALQSDDIDLSRRALRQFVEKIVISGSEGKIIYTFPELGNSSVDDLGYRDMDLRGFEPLTSTVRL